MDGIVWKRVPVKWRGAERTGEFNLALERGRRHVFLDPDSVASPLFDAATGIRPPSSGKVRVHGRRPSPYRWPRYSWSWTPPFPRWRRWLWEPPPPSFEAALARRAQVLFLEEPFGSMKEGWEEDARRLLEAHARERFTLLLRTQLVEVALAVGETFHVFSGEDGLRVSGDLESIFRPSADMPHFAPDRSINQGDGEACLVDFAGVRVPLNPLARSQHVSGMHTHFTAHFVRAFYHVPARHVVLEPPFVHGEPSGSGPLPPVVPLPKGSAPAPADTVARWVVLEGTVEERRPLGPWVRLELSSAYQGFQVDVRPEEAPALGTRVRFGFDSAHVVRERVWYGA